MNIFKINIAFTIIILFTNLSYASQNEYETALVLSGGGARGFAHIGVIKALEEIGFYPDVVIGTSMGAIIGALYCCGMTATEIEEYIKSINWTQILSGPKLRDIKLATQKMFELPGIFNIRFDENFNLVYPRNILSMQGLQDVLFQKIAEHEFLCNGDFDKLPIPFRVVATNIKNGKTVVIKNGSLSKAVAASSSFPLVFAPVKYGDYLLVDGGLTNNVPCDVADSLGANFIIAVDITSKITTIKGSDIDLFTYMGQTINTLSYYADTKNLLMADVLIRPELNNISSTDFNKIDTLIKIGYKTTQNYIGLIKNYISKKNRRQSINNNSLENVKIKKITIINNYITRDYVIKRELGLKEGETPDLDKIRKGYNNLLSTGLFNTIWVSINKIDKNNAELKIDVEENKRILYTIGARYYSERDSKAFIKLSYSNIFGFGINSEAFFIASNFNTNIGFNIINPGILTSNIAQILRFCYDYEKLPLYVNGEEYKALKFKESGVSFLTGVQIKRVGLTSVGTSYKTINIRDNRTGLNNNFYRKSIFINIFVDNRDDVDLPNRGKKNNITFEYATIDNLKLYKLDLESRAYEDVNKRSVYYTYLKVGYNSQNNNIYEYFRLGGIDDLPAYREDEFLGNIVMCAGVGYRLKVRSGIYYNIYFAYGDILNELKNFNWVKAKTGIMTGIIFATPIGPIDMEYSWNMKNRKSLYIRIGHVF